MNPNSKHADEVGVKLLDLDVIDSQKLFDRRYAIARKVAKSLTTEGRAASLPTAPLFPQLPQEAKAFFRRLLDTYGTWVGPGRWVTRTAIPATNPADIDHTSSTRLHSI
jgi:hypothetical protein